MAVLPVGLYGKYKASPDALFVHLHGSSWHGSDGAWIMWIDKHGVLLAAAAIMAVAMAATCLIVCRRRHPRRVDAKGGGGSVSIECGGISPGGAGGAAGGGHGGVAGVGVAAGVRRHVPELSGGGRG